MRLALVFTLVGATAALAQDMTPEPFRDIGYLQSCTLDGELPGCMIVGNGIRFVAATDGGTDPALMAQLQTLAANTRVEIAGDIISMGDITAEVVLKSVALAPDAKLDALMTGLQGDWQMVAGGGMQIVGSEWTEIVNGQPQDSYLMSVGQACTDGPDLGGPSIALLLMGGDPMTGGLCYAIDGIDEKSLTLTSKPDGAALKFQRP